MQWLRKQLTQINEYIDKSLVSVENWWFNQLQNNMFLYNMTFFLSSIIGQFRYIKIPTWLRDLGEWNKGNQVEGWVIYSNPLI